MIKCEKANYFRNILINSKGDCRKLWKYFKEATGKQQIKFVPVLNIDGNVVTDLYKIANAFNIYFTNVSTQVTKYLPKYYSYILSHEFINFITEKLSGQQTFSLPHISQNTVLKYLAHVNDR